MTLTLRLGDNHVKRRWVLCNPARQTLDGTPSTTGFRNVGELYLTVGMGNAVAPSGAGRKFLPMVFWVSSAYQEGLHGHYE